jgi:glycosyltransferase involved in cell wall biosynthesis
MAPRIAYVVTEDWYFTQHRLYMARAARDAGFEVHVLTRLNNGAAAIEREGFVPHPLSWQRRSTSPLSLASSVLEIRRLLRRVDPSLVHNVAVKPSIIGSLACAGLGRVSVVNSITGLGSAFVRTSPGWRVLQAGIRSAFALLFNRPRTVVVVQNPDDRAALVKAGVRPEKLALIPGSGVDTSAFQPLPEPELPVRIGYAGRMLENKGVRLLVEAFHVARQTGLEIRLILAGAPDPENPTAIPVSEIESWARSPGVRWLGHVDDIRKVWSRCHIAALASIGGEGLPKSLLEAAALGRPLIATDVAGCREVALHGRTGLLVPAGAVQPLADAIVTLARDANMRRRMGTAARALAVERFSAEDIGRQTVEIYRSLLACRQVGKGES